MNKTIAGILIATGVAGGAIYYAKQRRQKSILVRTRKQASKLSDSAASFLGKSRAEVVRAIGAGRAAYQRVAG